MVDWMDWVKMHPVFQCLLAWVIIKLVTQLCLIFYDPWTIALQAPPSMGFTRLEYCRGLPFPSPGDLPDSRIKPMSPTLQADSPLSEPPEMPFASVIGPLHARSLCCISLEKDVKTSLGGFCDTENDKRDFCGGLVVKNPPYNAEDMGSITGRET